MGISSKFSSPKWDFWQTLLSRGDETIGEFMIDVYKNGGKNSAYKAAYKKFGLSISKAIEGFSLNDTLPWDIIENYPSKQLLINEYNRLSKNVNFY